MLNDSTAAALLQCFSDHNTSISDFLCSILQNPHLQHHDLVCEFHHSIVDTLGTLSDLPTLRSVILDWAISKVNRRHSKSIRDLTSIKHGWHFSATNTSVDQIREFRIEDMVKQIKTVAPALWNTVRVLLSADPRLERRRSSQILDTSTDAPVGDPEAGEDDENEFWEEADGDLHQENEGTQRDSPSSRRSKTAAERHSIIELVSSGISRRHQSFLPSTTIESCVHHQHYDAKHQPEMQYTPKCLRHISSLLQHAATSHPVSRTHGHVNLRSDDPSCNQVTFSRNVQHPSADGRNSFGLVHLR